MIPVTVNYVLSSRLKSRIFDDIIARVSQGAPEDIVIRVSRRPLPDQTIYHFYRPQLEPRLPANAVTTVHHDPSDSDGWLDFSKFARRYSEAEINICLNAGQAAFLAERGISNTVVIPHGYDDAVLSRPEAPRQYEPGRKVVIGMVSRRYERPVKGEGLLAELLMHLPRDRFSFVFVGEDRWQEMVLARALGFHSECFDALPYGLFGELYAGLDLLLISSLHEGGPACLPEALATATPVIATPVGMVPDMVRPGEQGLFLSGDGRRDAAAIAALLDGDGLGLTKLFEGAFARAGATPTWDESVGRTIAVYRRIADRTARAA